MSKDFSFFPTETHTVTDEERKRLNSPEYIGQELARTVKGWTEKALSELSRHPDLMGLMPGAVDLKTPDWLDLSMPDHAVYEINRIGRQLPKYMPDEERMKFLTSDEKEAFEMVYRIRQLTNTVSKISIPDTSAAASAVIIMEASLQLGITAARVTVEKWESDVADRHKSKKALAENSKGSPEGSANKQKSECAKREHEKWRLAAKECLAKNGNLSAADIAKILKDDLELWQSVRTIRGAIKDAMPPKKVGNAR